MKEFFETMIGFAMCAAFVGSFFAMILTVYPCS